MKIEDLLDEVIERDKAIIKFLSEHEGEIFTCDEIKDEIKYCSYSEIIDDLCRLVSEEKISDINISGRLWFGTKDTINKFKSLLKGI